MGKAVAEVEGGTGVGLGAGITAVTSAEPLSARGLGPVAFTVVLAGEAHSTWRGEYSYMATSIPNAFPLAASGLGGSALSSSSSWLTSGGATRAYESDKLVKVSKISSGLHDQSAQEYLWKWRHPLHQRHSDLAYKHADPLKSSRCRCYKDQTTLGQQPNQRKNKQRIDEDTHVEVTGTATLIQGTAAFRGFAKTCLGCFSVELSAKLSRTLGATGRMLRSSRL